VAGDTVTADEFWKMVDASQSGELVASAIKLAQAQVLYSRATTASRRATILLGRNAGRKHDIETELHGRARQLHIQNVGQSLARFADRLTADQRKQIDEFLNKGGLKETATAAKQLVTLDLLHSDLAPDEVRSAMKSLDETLASVEGLSSFKEVTTYLNRHLEELSTPRNLTSANQGLCVLILILSSVFAVLVLIAALICIFSFGTACEGILQKLLDQACSSG